MAEQGKKKGRGRPREHANEAERKAANAEAARAYRARQRAKKNARRGRAGDDLDKLQATTFIDLSALRYSGRRVS
jgi:hypothetical protein